MTPQTVRIQLLGGPVARVAGRTVRSFETRKAAELLAFLALTPGRSYSRDTLAELLWPDEDPDATRVRLRQALSAIRRSLDNDSVLAGDRSAVCLDPDRITTDLQDLDRLRRQADDRSGADRESCLRRIVDLYEDDLLPDIDANWVTPERHRCADLFQESVSALAETHSTRGDHPAAIDLARKAVRQDPLRESAHVLLIRMFAAAGRSTEALRQFQELERTLRDDLGAAVSPETRRLADQIRAGDLARPIAPAPAPAPAQSPPPTMLSRLPTPVSRLFGREEELAYVCEALQPDRAASGRRLLTITGIGGTGKTRLAVEAAHALSGAYGGRVWFAALGDVEEPARIFDVIHEALGLERNDRTDSRTAIARALGADPALLVLDNLEHLGDAGCRAVSDLLGLAPALTCLVTSRHRLELRGERELPLGPLPIPRESLSPDRLTEFAGIQLFVDRVQAVRPRFVVTPENAAAVYDVCRTLDGLPLAIDLVAAWAAMLTPGQMRDRLKAGQGSGLDFLVSRSRETDHRHRSLRAALEGSLDQLPPHLQAFFCRLSIFHASFSLEGAEQVAGMPDIDCFTAVAELQARSLVREDETPAPLADGDEIRFRILGPVRAFALERLKTNGQAESMAEAHARHYFGMVEESRGLVQSSEARCMKRLDAEMENIRAALNWGRAHDPSAAILAADAICRFLQARGYAGEWRPWLDALMEQNRPSLSKRVLAAGLHAQGALAYARSDFVASRAAFEESIDILRELGDQEELVRALRHAGVVVRQMRDYAAARAFLEEALRCTSPAGDPRTRLLLELDLSYAHFGMGDANTAEGLAKQTLAGFRALGDTFGIASALNMVATIIWPQKRYQEARPLLAESIELARADGNLWLEGAGLHGLGDSDLYAGDHEGARTHLRAAMDCFRRRDSVVGQIFLIESLAALAVREGNADVCARLAGAAAARRAETGSPLPETELAAFETTMSMARIQLGHTGFGAAFTAGAQLTVDQAVELALSV